MWNQFCLKHPEFASSNILKNALGLEFVEENVFALAKEKAILEQGTGIVQTLAQLQNPDQTPVFSMKFLLQRYLSFTDDDWALNQKMLDDEKKKAEKEQKAGQAGGGAGAPGGDMGGGMDLGGGMDMGPGPDMGGGMDMGGGPEGGEPGGEAPDMGAGPGELPQAPPPDLGM
jgi:hypothetical protein